MQSAVGLAFRTAWVEGAQERCYGPGTTRVVRSGPASLNACRLAGPVPMRKRKPPPKRRNPVARAVRALRPQRVRNRKIYSRKGRRKASDLRSDSPEAE